MQRLGLLSHVVEALGDLQSHPDRSFDVALQPVLVEALAAEETEEVPDLLQHFPLSRMQIDDVLRVAERKDDAPDGLLSDLLFLGHLQRRRCLRVVDRVLFRRGDANEGVEQPRRCVPLDARDDHVVVGEVTLERRPVRPRGVSHRVFNERGSLEDGEQLLVLVERLEDLGILVVAQVARGADREAATDEVGQVLAS